MGVILLEGGAEFGGRMSDPDLRALQLAGGSEAPVAILPTAAAPDRNHERAGNNGLRWFRSLGASHLEVVPVIDNASANDPALAARVRSARLIYMLGGFPGYLAKTLIDSAVWRAALEAFAEGAVVGGSSAGAMVICQHVYDPELGKVLPGLDLLPNTCVLPHHNGFGKTWAPKLQAALPGAVLIGIDEQTGILNDALGDWTVYGAGQVAIYRGSAPRLYSSGEMFRLSIPSTHP